MAIIQFPEDLELEWRVKQLIAAHCESDAEELEDWYRLRSDLHMDGTDAERFFTQYGSQFDVDLKELRAGWAFYFRPQNMWLSRTVKLALALAASAGLLEWMVFPHLSGLAAFVTVGGLFAVVLLAGEIAGRMNRPAERPEMQEITIGELMDAARSGVWMVREEIRDWVAKQRHFRRMH